MLQITYGVLFSLVVTFVSDALSTSHEKPSLSSSDSSFRRDFHELVIFTDAQPDYISNEFFPIICLVGTYGKKHAHCMLSLLTCQVMRSDNNLTIEGFVGVVRLAWAVHLMLTQDRSSARDTLTSSSRDVTDIWACLEIICRQNSFQFLRQRIMQTAAYKVFITVFMLASWVVGLKKVCCYRA